MSNANNVRQRRKQAGQRPTAPPAESNTRAEVSHLRRYLTIGIGVVLGVVAITVLSGTTPDVRDAFAAALGLSRAFRLRSMPAPLVTESTLFDDAYRESMYWGTYRSGFYCGIRGREPKSVVAGVMWADMADVTQRFDIRHVARNEDALDTYGWVRHDLRSFGRQEMVDRGVRLDTSWFKLPSSAYGGDWALRVNITEGAGTARQSKRKYSLFFYVGHEPGVLGHVHLPAKSATVRRLKRQTGTLIASGQSSSKPGDWQVHAAAGSSLSALSSAALSLPVFHNMSDVVMGLLREKLQRGASTGKIRSIADFDFLIPSSKGADSRKNVALVQVQVTLPFSMDFVFVGGLKSSDNTPEHEDVNHDQDIQARVGRGISANLTSKLSQAEQAFESRFHTSFSTVAMDKDVEETALAALSNMVGSMGYFWGSSLVRMPGAKPAAPPAATQPRPLFTAVPSRSFFPRGFLWDEGFHELLVQQWDVKASCDALAHWLDLMNENGWIPREMILGAEAESRVPAEYIQQHPDAANPPTLFLPIMNLVKAVIEPNSALLKGSDTSREHVLDFLQRAWPRLVKWWHWFDRSQAGQEPSSYRWAGRDALTTQELNPKTLTSGLDDFPRASHPSVEERHVDLRCWMAFASQAMAMIGRELKLPASVVAPFEAKAAALLDLQGLKRLHLDEPTGMFLDWGLHTEDVELVDNGPDSDLVRVVTGAPPRLQFVPHFGYNSLFPLTLQLLPPHAPELNTQLDLLKNSSGNLWTPFGLRSLSSSSSLYDKYNTRHDAPYWRSPIWVNINFLVLRSLRHYSRLDGPYQDKARRLYAELRSNLLSNMAKQYGPEPRGFIWENYNDKTGAGLGSHPFTGWSALVVLIATERY